MRAEGGRVTLEIPAGALDETVEIRVVRSTADRKFPKSGLLAGAAYEFAPHGLTFKKPAKLTLQYDRAQVRAGVAPQRLVVLAAIHPVNGDLTEHDPWEERPSTVDVSRARVTATIEHFSHLGVGEAVAAIHLAPPSLSMFAGDRRLVTAVQFGACTPAPCAPEDGIPLNHAVEWSSDAPTVASVVSCAGAPADVCAGEPTNGRVTAVAAGTATITGTARNSAAPAVSAAITATVAGASADIVLVLDQSGSMSATDFAPADMENRLTKAATAARFFAARVRPDGGHRIGVVSYNQLLHPRTALLAADSTLAPEAATGSPFSTAIGAILTDGPDGSTSIGAGVRGALELLGGASNRKRSVVLLTDGRQNTRPCLARRVGETLESNQCDFAGDLTQVTSNLDPAIAGIEFCSIGMGLGEGQIDERILRAFSNDGQTYIDAASNAADYNSTMAAFAKCAPGLNVDGSSGTGVDPSGVLARGRVAASSYTYDSCADARLTFASGWQRSADFAGDLRLHVHAPDGSLHRFSSANDSRTRDWDIQRVPGPSTGSYRFQLARDTTRIVNGFTSDAFVDHAAGVRLARRELQRLCADGCGKVLYFEDGRADPTARSIYADALAAERASPSTVVDEVVAFTEADAVAFTSALAVRDYGLLVYIHQLASDGSQQEPYDEALNEVLCNSVTRALITDTRALVAGQAAQLFHACSGALPTNESPNYSQLVDPDGQRTLLDGALPLVNRGYTVGSYAIAAWPLDIADIEDNLFLHGATQLEGGSDKTFVSPTTGPIRIPFGSIVSFSSDVVGSKVGTTDPEFPTVRERVAEQWSSQVDFEGLGGLSVGALERGGSLTVSAYPLGLAPGSVQNQQGWVRVTRPAESLSSLFARFGCTGRSSPSGDLLFGSLALRSFDIPVRHESYGLRDDGTSGDPIATDGVLAGAVDAPVSGTYALTYTVEFDLQDASGRSCRAHREARVTRYVGEEILASGDACAGSPGPATTPSGLVGDDPATCPAGTNVIVGSAQNDTLIGTDGPDCILGLGGDDNIRGLGGNDVIAGGSGNDNLGGDAGDDVISGGPGNDTIDGGLGGDTIDGGLGDDVAVGGAGNDTVNGGDGIDRVDGSAGDDQVNGGAGDDDVRGGGGNDGVEGGGGSDTCTATPRASPHKLGLLRGGQHSCEAPDLPLLACATCERGSCSGRSPDIRPHGD